MGDRNTIVRRSNRMKTSPPDAMEPQLRDNSVSSLRYAALRLQETISSTYNSPSITPKANTDRAYEKFTFFDEPSQDGVSPEERSDSEERVSEFSEVLYSQNRSYKELNEKESSRENTSACSYDIALKQLGADKKVYFIEEILRIGQENRSFMKPLDIVRIERRKFELKQNSVEEPIPKIGDGSGKSALKTSTDKLTRKIKLGLNKLSNRNIDQVKSQLLETGKENISLLAKEVYKRACTQVKYLGTYAYLCDFIIKKQLLESESLFKQQIIKEIKDFFELQECKTRKELLGTARFVAELFKFKLVSDEVLLVCIKNLISSELESIFNDLELETQIVEEPKIEALVTLISSLGNSTQTPQFRNKTALVFLILRQIVEKRLVSNKVRFTVMNFIEPK